MKFYFIIDSLLEEDIPSFILELLLSFDPSAPIYTFAYNPEKFSGRFHAHRIESTNLNRRVKNQDDFIKHLWLLPFFTNHFKYDEDRTPIIISSGFAHLLLPKKLQQKAYVYLFQLPSRNLNLKQNIIIKKIINWSEKQLLQFPFLITAHFSDTKKIPGSRFVGCTFPTRHVVAVKVDPLQPAEVIWDLSGEYFPAQAIKEQAKGNMVIVKKGVDTGYLHPEGYIEMEEPISAFSMNAIRQQAEQKIMNLDRSQLRRFALRWSERTFKTQFQAFLRGEGP